MRSTSLLLAVLSFGFAPAPFPPPDDGRLEGTSWSGADSSGKPYTFHFLKGGALSYTSTSGTFRTGSWKQFRDTVTMETNNRYWEFKGNIIGKTLQGAGTNIRGGRWTYKLTKDPKKR
jgi:hypothetical protein